MGKLSTHVLDTTNGRPARDMRVDLSRVDGSTVVHLRTIHTNADGRCPEPLLQDNNLKAGVYELVFHAGQYFADQGISTPEPRFVDQVVIRFGIANQRENYHVPLIVTPWSWSTYRGS